MDLGAFLLINSLKGLLPSEPPRLRGLRLMKLEDKIEEETSPQYEMFNKYAGTDTLYIHTRCGGYNYYPFEMDKWEKDNKAEGVDDEFDITYRDSYIAIPEDKMEDYQKILIAKRKEKE